MAPKSLTTFGNAQYIHPSARGQLIVLGKTEVELRGIRFNFFRRKKRKIKEKMIEFYGMGKNGIRNRIIN